MVVAPSAGGSTTTTTTVRPPATNGASSTTRTKMNLTGNGYHPANAASIPLSARRAPPLDMSSVERRGQPLTSREMPKRVRPHGLQEAPTYRPTEEEFKDPFQYMQKIAPEGRRYGIVKIIPPDGWNPDFAIDSERFHFRTRRQELNSVEGGTRANLTYLDQLAKFHKQHGTNLNRFPSVDKRPLDLYKLKKAVEVRGGFDKVCKVKKWAEIGRDLGYSGKIMSSLSTSLKNSYQRWLHPYEEYLRVAKPGVQQQLEFEYGGPLTPSPVPSPVKKSHQHTPSSLRDDSPAVRASAALHASVHDAPDPDHPTSARDATQRPPSSTGFTAVNAGGGFTPVNASPASFTAVNVPNGFKREAESVSRSVDSPMSSSKNTPEYRPSGLNPVANGHAGPSLKRRLSQDSPERPSGKDQGRAAEAPDSGERRSKRLKKEAAPTVAGSHMTLFRPSTPRIPGDKGAGKAGEKCESCSKGDEAGALLLCDGCDNAYHPGCLDPPVKTAPDSDWHCPRCLVGTGEFGFEEGGVYSLKQFQEKAHTFKESYFLPKMPFDPVLNCRRPVTEDDVEREFWRLVESLTETVEVEYGADIHSTTHGSGFPTIEKNPLDSYATDPWNLNILPLHGESLFRHIKSDISGMTVPWLYVGMCFSTFCWHNEDHYTYSANYQHFGATKTWYGIPGEDAERFEAAMRAAVPELFETQPDLLFQLVTLLPPDQLKKAGVNVCALDQRAGQFVVTFPQAYHAGFNHGFNFNEAVNFAPHDWEPFGDTGVQRLQAFRRQPCFSHDELLLTAAARDSTITTAKWLAPALERLRDREIDQRRDLATRHKALHGDHCDIDAPPLAPAQAGEEVDEAARCPFAVTVDGTDVPEEEYQCHACKTFSYLSRVQCHRTGKVACLLHALSVDCCEMSAEARLMGHDHSLCYRLTDEALCNLVQKVIDRAKLPETWTEKLEKTLEDEPRPSLKSLRALLAEGERIPHPLTPLPTLKAFVERCNDWVEEATNYIVRKQQNRRKNEKAWRKGQPSKATAELEERDREGRTVEHVLKLLAEADDIAFDCPEIAQLRERAEAIQAFQRDARTALLHQRLHNVGDFEELVEVGRGFNVDIPEVERLDQVVQQLRWTDVARERRGQRLNLAEVSEMLRQGTALGLPDHHEHLRYFREQQQAGELWEAKAQELMAAETVNYQQLEALSGQAAALPVSRETLAAVDQILNKQREAHRQIISLYERSTAPDLRQRPKYKEVRDVLDALAELHSKPTGTLDLEREQKRHEDWMRKGKKLFGKANAPLHILLQHMQYVEMRNAACLSTTDRNRGPAEPSSRAASPDDSDSAVPMDPSKQSRDVFCICRQPESGMMIECELCHEWYHGKCMKIARGKVKEFDYTCPICDWRVKIPRDAARPKLEDLLDWQAEIPVLPFQPDEEACLSRIVNQAQDFRDFIRLHMNPALSTAEEVPTQRFYLRKIEGAEILLSWETNFFRQELHKWAPVAPEPPPVLEFSFSTRKPRPTKQQKLMAQLGIDNPDDLPQSLRTRPYQYNKRKSSEPHTKPPPLLQPAPGRGVGGNVHPFLPPSAGGSSMAYDAAFHLASPGREPGGFVDGDFLPDHADLGSPSYDGAPSRPPIGASMFHGGSFGREGPDEGSPEGDMDEIFDDLTNHDVDGLGSSHATEALAVLGETRTNGDGHSGDETGEDTQRREQGREGSAEGEMADRDTVMREDDSREFDRDMTEPMEE
ncbi:MAG: hypothetical protein M1838_004748 [Thelocarpon superellum]|nr:MAG: hypothetical protein M1838_004748 [Thelocarpon superellum]